MGSKSLAKMVKQVFSNEGLKAQFLPDPHSVMAKYKLNKQEKAALLDAHAGLKNPSSEAVLEMKPMAMWP